MRPNPRNRDPQSRAATFKLTHYPAVRLLGRCWRGISVRTVVGPTADAGFDCTGSASAVPRNPRRPQLMRPLDLKLSRGRSSFLAASWSSIGETAKRDFQSAQEGGN